MNQIPSSLQKKQRQLPITIMLLLFCILLAACSSQTVNISVGNGNSNQQSQSSGSQDASGTQHVQVYVEPDAGEQVITSAIQNAQKSVWLEVYLLTDKHIITALEDAAHRHIDVRVMLESHPYGGGSVSPQETLDTLKAAGVQAQATNPQFALTHEKGMVIDNQTAYIMTNNLTLAALGVSKYTKNREYGIIDTNTQDVQTVSAIFTADWQRQPVTINDANMVVSPINSRDHFTNLINSAKKSLLIEAEEMQDTSIEQALVRAERRGVQVQVILPKGSSQEASGSSGNSKGITTIKNGGVQVKEDSKLYIHAKIIVADGQKAFIGSENISTASLERNRELGIIVSDSGVLNTLQQTFQQDWSSSKAA